MKLAKKIICTFLFSILLLTGTVPASAAEKDAAEFIETEVTSSGAEVTVTVTAAKNMAVTSGRFVVLYDANVLTLKTETSGHIWETEDVNSSYETEGCKGIAFAFASEKEVKTGGTLLTLTFLANNEADGVTTAISTTVKELYQNDVSLLDAENTSSKEVTISLPVDATEGATEEAEDHSLDEIILEKIKTAVEGDVIVIELSKDDTVLSADVMTELMGKDITLEFKSENGVVWKINGKKIKAAKAIDLGVILNSNAIPDSIVNGIKDDGIQYKMQISLAFDGEFGAEMEVQIPVGTKGAGYFANLYYYNPSTKALEYMQTVKVGADGMAAFTLTHASDYVIAISSNDASTLEASVSSVDTTTVTSSETVDTGDDADIANSIFILALAVVAFAYAGKRMVDKKKIARK